MPSALLHPPSRTHPSPAQQPGNSAEMYYIFFDAEQPEGDLKTTPIILWLQGVRESRHPMSMPPHRASVGQSWSPKPPPHARPQGPGCSSLFGMLYINGPYSVQPDLTLLPNPGRWNKCAGGTLHCHRGLAPCSCWALARD